MVRAVCSTLASACRLAGGLVRIVPALLWRKRRAVAVFRAQLRGLGLPNELVMTLAAEYKSMLSLGELAAFSNKGGGERGA